MARSDYLGMARVTPRRLRRHPRAEPGRAATFAAMLVVGLTGGIGAGKSTVAGLLAELGAAVVDADAVVHELQAAGTPVLAAMVERFGPGILRPDGELD